MVPSAAASGVSVWILPHAQEDPSIRGLLVDAVPDLPAEGDRRSDTGYMTDWKAGAAPPLAGGAPSQLWTVPTVLTSIGEEEPNAVPGVDSDLDDAQPWGANPT